MTYLITQIIVCLLIAAAIGFIIGWFLKGMSNNNQEQNTQAEVSLSKDNSKEPVSGPVTRAPSISHKIEAIEGIGKSLGRNLHRIGIRTTKDLIKKCDSAEGIRQIEEKTKVVESVLKQWLSMADLMRVPNVDGQFAELLEASGVKSVQDLAHANSEALVSTLQSVNNRENRIPDSIALPDLATIQHWVKDAQSLAAKLKK